MRRAGVAALVAGVAYLVILIWDREAFVSWMSEAHPVPFFIAMAVLPAIGAPLSPLLLLAGATFGVRIGLVGTVAALALNLCICYAIAQSQLRPRFTAMLERFDYELPDFAAGGRKAWRFATAMKLTPALPAFAKTYGLAVTGVPFPIYFGVSMIVSSLFAVAWIVLGDSLLEHELGRSAWAAIAGLVLLVIALRWWKKRQEVSDDGAAVA
jgi:uncharacterized membrane protein YdjX (TVP38/TMEM64 family)